MYMPVEKWANEMNKKSVKFKWPIKMQNCFIFTNKHRNVSLRIYYSLPAYIG